MTEQWLTVPWTRRAKFSCMSLNPLMHTSQCENFGCCSGQSVVGFSHASFFSFLLVQILHQNTRLITTASLHGAKNACLKTVRTHSNVVGNLFFEMAPALSCGWLVQTHKELQAKKDIWLGVEAFSVCRPESFWC